MSTPSPKDSKDQQITDLVVAVLSLVALVAVMVWWWTYPRPNGNHPRLLDLFQFFPRESLLIAFIVVSVMSLAVATAWRALKRIARRRFSDVHGESSDGP
ncbi:hypothetical protein [Mitsuaria sp. GD03876]|uniref:hypothetical protein n=1 Tax=Mitsuaria sp. GD03876 TaxID=2975399 RepID=UPI00244D5594|nr:hypothetical protein [Mitsuaria sp. GD03876]MDH0863922.1 hypothetical protein [Mitsuaria sp. GD03876]